MQTHDGCTGVKEGVVTLVTIDCSEKALCLANTASGNYIATKTSVYINFMIMWPTILNLSCFF